MPRPPAKRPTGYDGNVWREVACIVAIIVAALIVAATFADGICRTIYRPCGPSVGLDPPARS